MKSISCLDSKLWCTLKDEKEGEEEKECSPPSPKSYVGMADVTQTFAKLKI